MKVVLYTDINTIKPIADGKYVTDITAIIQALYNFITTEIGERRYKFHLGFSASDYVFQIFDDSGEFQLKSDLLNKLKQQEPRVEVLPSFTKVTADPANSKYKLKLVFKVKGLSDEKFTFYGAIFK